MPRLVHLRSLDDIAPADWDALFPGHYPFTRHAFLASLERTGAVGPETGWTPLHALLLADGADTPVAAAPLYLRAHSWGEFVFDFAWADAARRAGLRYYPKLTAAVPFVPSAGPRLGAVDAPARQELARALAGLAETGGASGLHVLFADGADGEALAAAGFVPRHDTQYQWFAAGEADFEGFLGRLRADKRKNIRRERRAVAEAGLVIAWRRGREIPDAEWPLIHALYANTYEERGGPPYYPLAFLQAVAQSPAMDMWLCCASDADGLAAVALNFRGGDTLYGRHWGTRVDVPGLHFELCYYQGIELCLGLGLSRYDAGTQGSHKMLRGFAPVGTTSWHRLAHPGLAAAVARFLAQERAEVAARRQTLAEHTAFRATDGHGPAPHAARSAAPGSIPGEPA